MKYILALVVLAIVIDMLTSCATPGPPPLPEPPLVACAKAPKPPPVPGEPRTTEGIAAYANAMRIAFERAVEARDDCAQKLEMGTGR